ncbi:MAG: tripartite tricarboxylate transporter TctB family protein [Desulfobacterales bacterium]|nr:tripartite tricarboxylate transporter TctB family protein [Desulfobacterales bacterium]
MKKAEEIGFATLLVIIFAMFVILGWGYAKRPRIVPLTLSIPGLAFSVIHLANSIVKSKRAGKKQDADPEASAKKPLKHQKAPLPGEGRKILEVWAWIIVLALGINFLGFMIAIPIFLLAFLRFFAKRSWKISTIIAASFVLAVYLVFYVGLRTTL